MRVRANYVRLTFLFDHVFEFSSMLQLLLESRPPEINGKCSRGVWVINAMLCMMTSLSRLLVILTLAVKGNSQSKKYFME